MLPLRYRAFVVVVLVTLAPVLFVLASNIYEGGLKQRLRAETVEVAEVALEHASSTEPPATLVRLLADDAQARVRILSSDRRVLAEHDASRRSGLWHAIADFFAGPGTPHALAELDAELGALRQQPELAEAMTHGSANGCVIMDSQRMLRCFAVQRLSPDTYVYVEKASRRGTRALYEQRYQVLKVALFVLPGALLLAAWLSWRMIRPIERLRSQIQQRSARLGPGDDLPVERSDEFGELAGAFNDLLAKLRHRTEQNEAFVADLAHEFKNPVAAIRAAAERLEQGGLDAERTARIAHVLDRSSRKLDELVSEFLELASADAGMRGEERTPVALSLLVRALLDQLASDERFERVRFSLDARSDATLTVVERRVRAAIGNLLENAANFAGDGGQVQVRVQRIHQELQLEVQDSGPGIARADLPHVFDRFFTRREGGTGLGLALVRAVVEAHNGRVEAASEPGQGATFRLHFPLPNAGC